MELSDLTVFRTVVEEGGISAAAARLHRVPSNVTARIKKLEAEMGTPLFVREKNRLTISQAGAQLMGYAEKILNLAEEAVNQLQHTMPRGKLLIGSMESVAATRLARWLSEYHEIYPTVEISLQSGPTGALIEDVLKGTLDIAFVADPPEDPRLCSVPVIRETLVLVSHSGHKAVRHPDQLEGSPTLLGFNARCAYRKRLEQWLAQGKRAYQVVEIGSYHTLLSCAAAGMGVGLVTRSVVETFTGMDRLKVHRLPRQWSQTTTCMIARRDNQSNAARVFMASVSDN